MGGKIHAILFKPLTPEMLLAKGEILPYYQAVPPTE